VPFSHHSGKFAFQIIHYQPFRQVWLRKM